MHNRFDSLLKRCKRRKRKLLLRRMGILTLVLLVFGGGIAYLETSSLTPVYDTETPAGAMIKPKASRPVSDREPSIRSSETKPVKKGEDAAEKTGDFVKRELIVLNKEEKPKKETTRKTVTKPKKPKRVVTESQSTTAVSEPKRPPKKTILFEEKKEPTDRHHSKPLIEVKDVTNLDALVRQFDKYPRYETALKIAEIYFDRGDFEKASLWSRKANLLDRDDEAAWILYAKSEYALGRKERAIRILKLYLDYKDSARARTLLLTWSKG